METALKLAGTSRMIEASCNQLETPLESIQCSAPLMRWRSSISESIKY